MRQQFSDISACVKKTGLMATISLVMIFTAGQAFSQDSSNSESIGLEEITVTAQRVSENLQRAPVAVSAFTAEALENRQITSVKDISYRIPNTLISPTTGVANAARIFVRGVGQDNSGLLSDPAVGVYVDNIYMPRINGALFDFFDVERVEVLRGPQGTLYGRNSSGGAVNIISKKPSYTTSASGDIAYGRFDTFDVRGYVTGPLVEDKVAASVSALYRSRDGLMLNTVTNKKVNDREVAAVRGKLLFTPNDDFEIVFSLDYSDDNSDPLVGAPLTNFPGVTNANARPDRDPYTTEITGLTVGNLSGGGASLHATYNVDDVTFTSITGYRRLNNDLVIPLLMFPTGPLLTSFELRDNSFSQEFNAAYDSESFKGVMGLYYFREVGRDREYYSGPPRDLNRSTDASAVYAQGTYKVTEDLGLTGGLRYTSEKTDFRQHFYTQRTYSQSASKRWDSVTPKAGVEWQVVPELMAYASYTKGFKSGSFNAVAPNTNTGTGVEGAPIAYDPEKVDSYEIGGKFQSSDNRFRFNVALFNAKYKGLQLPVFFPGTVNSYTSNAAGARVRGIEVESSYKVSSELEVYANISHQGDKYTSAFLCSDAFNRIVNCQDRQLKSLIPTQASFGFTYEPELQIDGQIRIGTDWNYISGYWNNVSNTVALEKTAAQNIINAFISYETPDERWVISAEGKNITDRQYYGSVLQIGSAVSPAVVGYPVDPATWMVRLKFRY